MLETKERHRNGACPVKMHLSGRISELFIIAFLIANLPLSWIFLSMNFLYFCRHFSSPYTWVFPFKQRFRGSSTPSTHVSVCLIISYSFLRISPWITTFDIFPSVWIDITANIFEGYLFKDIREVYI